ncbi:MAG: lyase family protein [Pyrinomonadaceae bacterium]
MRAWVGCRRRTADAIVAAADEVLSGQFADQFVVDVFQAGAGTSHNMNTNEVLANRAIELIAEQSEAWKRSGATTKSSTRTTTSTWRNLRTT